MTDQQHGEQVLPGAALRLTVGAGEPVSGTVLVDGHSELLTFCGWIELMAVINDVRQRPTT